MVIKLDYLNKKIELTDVDNIKWQGMANVITSALDSESGENEIAIDTGLKSGFVEFRESEIKCIVI